MSRIGKQPIKIPAGVELKIDNDKITVKGPKGTLEQNYLPLVSFKQDNGELIVSRLNESKQARAMNGLYRALAANMVTGVTEGFTKTLIINGVGFRAELQGTSLILNLGFSNPIEFVLPEGIKAEVENNTKVKISGIDKMLVGKISAELRSLRKPEPYKGKGIRYEDETIRRKVGKSGVK